MPSLIASLRLIGSLGRLVTRIVGAAPLASKQDAEVSALVRQAGEAARAGRRDEARRLYRQALATHKNDVGALRGLRDIAVELGAWSEALELTQRLTGHVAALDRAREMEWLAAIHYELGRTEADRGQPAMALGHFKQALKAERNFVPAALALGDAYEATGDHREAIRTWERALESMPAPPLLARLERAYRQEGRPSRMIALYRDAVERAPDDLALAIALGRVYFELEMLDEAADQFEKVEVRAPDLPAVHAFLGAVFERRGEAREAFEEYRRGLRLAGAYDWPQRCVRCGATASTWRARCAQCGRWNTFRPVEGR
jgi:lipopolysaccharide biosynthesis regulator YciM